MGNGGHRELLAVLEHDPDLGEDLAREQLARARSQALARAYWQERGRWRIPVETESTANLGFLVINGFVARELSTGNYTSVELLGPGDVVHVRDGPAWEQPSVAVAIDWAVLQRLRVASLDREFLLRVSQWPEIVAAISRRLAWRTKRLLFQVALSALRRIDDRVLLMLWQFGDRWGTIRPDGVLLDLPLTHELLAAVVGGQRPSVSAAVSRLVEQQRIRPLPRSRWLLLGMPPANFCSHEVGPRPRDGPAR